MNFYCHPLRLIIELDGIVRDDPVRSGKMSDEAYVSGEWATGSCVFQMEW